jgi:hypothetical protein
MAGRAKGGTAHSKAARHKRFRESANLLPEPDIRRILSARMNRLLREILAAFVVVGLSVILPAHHHAGHDAHSENHVHGECLVHDVIHDPAVPSDGEDGEGQSHQPDGSHHDCVICAFAASVVFQPLVGATTPVAALTDESPTIESIAIVASSYCSTHFSRGPPALV